MFASLFRASAGRSASSDFWYEPVAVGGSGRVSHDAALALTAVYACVRVLSESFALLPARLYRPRVGGGREQVTDHWLHRLLNRRPNRWQTPFEWREMLQGHLALRGNAFCQLIDDGRGGIDEFLPLHPDRITVEMLGEYAWRYRYVRRDGSTMYLAPGEVWHLRGLSGDGVCGYNPIEVEREALGEALQFQGYSSRFFANNATPPMWVSMPGKFTDRDARARFREQIQEAQVGRNRGKTMVLDQGMELHTVGINHKDMQFLEVRAAKVSEIARMFRVQPHKIGDLSKATFSNIEQQSIEFWTDTMQPWAERWESSIEAQLLGEESDIEIEFDMRAQMRGDAASRAAYIHSGVLDGWLTRNEGRALEGLDPIEGLDEPLVPLNSRGLTDPDPNTDSGAADAMPEVPALPAEDDGADAARLARVLSGNAERMARRIAGGSLPSAEVLADAMDIDVHVAHWWLSQERHAGESYDLAAELLALAMKGQP